MHPGDSRVDRDHPVQLPQLVASRLHCGQDPLPGAIFSPPVETFEDGVPWAEPFRQVPPRRTCAKPPRDSLHDHPMIQPRATTPMNPRQQRLNHSPRLIRNHITLMHNTIVTDHSNQQLDQHALVLGRRQKRLVGTNQPCAATPRRCRRWRGGTLRVRRPRPDRARAAVRGAARTHPILRSPSRSAGDPPG
jgi:hypothetical protein